MKYNYKEIEKKWQNYWDAAGGVCKRCGNTVV